MDKASSYVFRGSWRTTPSTDLEGTSLDVDCEWLVVLVVTVVLVVLVVLTVQTEEEGALLHELCSIAIDIARFFFR